MEVSYLFFGLRTPKSENLRFAQQFAVTISNNWVYFGRLANYNITALTFFFLAVIKIIKHLFRSHKNKESFRSPRSMGLRDSRQSLRTSKLLIKVTWIRCNRYYKKRRKIKQRTTFLNKAQKSTICSRHNFASISSRQDIAARVWVVTSHMGKSS